MDPSSHEVNSVSVPAGGVLRLRMAGVHKSFGATRALRGVHLEVGTGEIHALIGENGAGKSTLMKILSGACLADEGIVELDGKPFVPSSPLHARAEGIAMIYQELTLAPHLSVEENILLGAEPSRWGWLRQGRRREMAHAALQELHHENISCEALAGELTIAEQQVVEIARALIGSPRVLIMDEPTSSLTQVDTENLFRVIRKLKQRGVSVVYISHFLEECLALCDRFSVLRDGESISSGAMGETDLSRIIRDMAGREISEIYPRTPRTAGDVVYEWRGLAGVRKPSGVDLSLRAGEVLGVAGLVGAGRTESLRAAFGLDRARAGEIRVFGTRVESPTPKRNLDAGVGLVSENRKEEGLMLARDLADNLAMTRFGPFSKWGFISRRRQRECAWSWMEKLSVKAAGPDQTIGELSGGNQQKVALARLLHHEARVLLLDEPTRGIDVGSKAQIYSVISELAAAGKAVIVVSSYLPELLGVCDRVAVMCRGALKEIRPVEEWDEHSIMTAMVGAEGVAGEGGRV